MTANTTTFSGSHLPSALGVGITHVEARAVQIPFARPIVTPNYRIAAIDSILVRASDADGVVGHGYLWCVNQGQVRPLFEALRYLAARLVGSTPCNLGATYGQLMNDINFLGFKGVSVFGLSGLELALRDLQCRRLGVSLSSMLGRVRDRVPAYWSGLMLTETDEDLIREASRLSDLGFRACKIRVGRAGLEEDARRIRLVREHLAPGTAIMLDAVQYYSAREAIEASKRFEEFSPIWLEEPVRHDDHASLRTVTQRSRVPVAGGENEYLPQGFADLLATGVDFLVVDLERVGGITGWLTTAALTAQTSTVMTPHVYPHVSLHLVSALSQPTAWVEYMPWWDDLMTYEMKLDDGCLVVNDLPGTGVDLDASAVDRFATTGWERLA